MRPMRLLRAVALIEGASLLALVCIAVPLKHLAGFSGAVSLMGPVHGMAFLMYLWVVVNTVSGEDWSKREIARMLLAAVIPGGAFLNAGFMARKDWALQQGDSTADDAAKP